jgi:Leucine-rich repeat (LRR) protein
MCKHYIDIEEEGITRRLIVKSKWYSSYEQIIIDNNINAIRLSFSNGWTDDNIIFLERIRGLRCVEIYSWKVSDLTSLYKLFRLTSICAQVSLKKEFDLAHFPLLSTLKINLSFMVKNLAACKELEHVNIINYPYMSFEEMSNLKKLSSMYISSNQITSMMGICNFTKLQELDLYDCKKLKSLAGIKQAKALKNLTITKCKNLNSIEEVGELHGLNSLVLEDCGEIQSINCLRECKKIKRLLLIGETYVINYDESVIEDIPSLTDVRFSKWRKNKK